MTIGNKARNKPLQQWLVLVAWYVLFGALHEMAHLLTAATLLSSSSNHNNNNNIDGHGLGDTTVHQLIQSLLLRQTVIPSLALPSHQGDDDNDRLLHCYSTVIRHAGWVVSFVLAILVCTYSHCRSRRFHHRQQQSSSSSSSLYDSLASMAAVVTCMEAISTDLLGANVFYDNNRQHVFCCGNFGIFLLHSAWWNKNNGRSSSSPILDILSTMVRVTSMRGAQSGGVVTFQQDVSSTSLSRSVKGIRCRVVNKKRTDLSEQLCKHIQRNVHLRPNHKDKDGDAIVFAGHTRFATSSKATLEGTHPQQWTPPTATFRVYDLDQMISAFGNHSRDDSTSSAVTTTTTTTRLVPYRRHVENYVTHNGDFEHYKLNGITYDVHVVQTFLQTVLGHAMPSSVDSAAIAGLVDVMRTKGCFGLSARCVVCLGLSTSHMNLTNDTYGSTGVFPNYSHFEEIGFVFEQVLTEMLKTTQLETICHQVHVRQSFAMRVRTRLEARFDALMGPLRPWVTSEENDNDEDADAEKGKPSILTFCLETINAFFDNDLFQTTKTFLQNAKGSFGLSVSSSLDAHRQICLAARGQTMSIAFYPNKGLVCYGSEQAAVKAGLNVDFPGDNADVLGRSQGDIDNDGLRLDLDDLGGEVILLDWGRKTYTTPPVSKPNENLLVHELMNGSLDVILYQESKATTRDPQLYHRMTRLTRNRFIKPLLPESDDPILTDIQDIPKVCKAIQEEWQADKAATSMNRLTAFNLSRCLRTRLEAHIAGKTHPRAIDILLTGCEVSLWLAEQFASDLQKAFPNLRIKAVSSNKLLGLYGQEVPALGFPDDPKTHHLHDAIVVIVSHSGGTFAPLACSNLLQSQTKNIFVVTSEWDTQIGKQLRAMDALDDEDEDHIFTSRIFSTEVGMRSAEPCSVSVVATHQLLTNLLEYICAVILSEKRFRRISGAAITETDLQVLEKCNRENIDALCDIVGVTMPGKPVAGAKAVTELHLRRVGDLWANHVLENARAYIMTFVYVFVTVTIGYPLLYGISVAAGLDPASSWMYLVRLFDSAIYFWMPQISITILRLFQGRNLRHRMVGRTVVIGDIPYVAQAAEAFLSKIFACSYSIAGVNVLSGNPADHFVHRHTHRVVRGTLVICGRPDGRLSALSTAEAAVCLSVNQASSIQSLGGTCESITIGHNPFKLPLSHDAIILKRKRPLFLCERMLVETDFKDEQQTALSRAQSSADSSTSAFSRNEPKQLLPLSSSKQPPRLSLFRRGHHNLGSVLDSSSHHSRHDPSVKPRLSRRRSASALIGAYANLEEPSTMTTVQSIANENNEHDALDDVQRVVEDAIKQRKWSDHARKLFHALDLDQNGFIGEEEFVEGSYQLQSILSDDQLRSLFRMADGDGSGRLDYDEFLEMLRISNLHRGVKLPPSNRNERGIIHIEAASNEKYFGEVLRKYNAGKSNKKKKNADETNTDFMLAKSQHFAQELYETRIASVQRLVAMIVMFHQMGKVVRDFFVRMSLGMLDYKMERTHSIMRIATTASPVSGSDVRHRMRQLHLLKKVQHSVHVISLAYLQYKGQGQEPEKGG